MDRLIIHVNYSAQQSVKHKNTFIGPSSGVERKKTRQKLFQGRIKGICQSSNQNANAHFSISVNISLP